jgi:predicted dehydrogenase
MNRKDNLSNFKQSYEREIKSFINAALGLSPVISSLTEACQVMKVMDAIHLSAERGQEVILSDIS